MTEIRETNSIDWPAAQLRRIDAWSFAFAAVLTPFAFGFSGLLFIVYGALFTLGAAVVGFPAYLLFGLPAAYIALSRLSDGSRSGDYGSLFVVAVLANAGSFAMAYGYEIVDHGRHARAVSNALTYAGLGLIAGPIQALIFGWIYRVFALERAHHTDTRKQHEGEIPCA